jgi:hypothetical protein
MKPVIIFTFLFLFPLFSYSQNGNRHLVFLAGAQTNFLYSGRVGLEFSKKYHNSINLSADFVRSNTFKEWYVNTGYTSNLSRAKNISLRLPIEVGIGTDERRALALLGGGLEFNIATKGNVNLTFRQMNQIAFGSIQRWRFGLQAGIKIPIN